MGQPYGRPQRRVGARGRAMPQHDRRRTDPGGPAGDPISHPSPVTAAAEHSAGARRRVARPCATHDATRRDATRPVWRPSPRRKGARDVFLFGAPCDNTQTLRMDRVRWGSRGPPTASGRCSYLIPDRMHRGPTHISAGPAQLGRSSHRARRSSFVGSHRPFVRLPDDTDRHTLGVQPFARASFGCRKRRAAWFGGHASRVRART